jgi:hypothetical protein
MSDYWCSKAVSCCSVFQGRGEGAWQSDAARGYDLYRNEKQAQRPCTFRMSHMAQIFRNGHRRISSKMKKGCLNMRRLGVSKQKVEPLPSLAVHLWDSAEERGMFTGNTDLRHLDARRNEVHLLWLPDLRGDDFLLKPVGSFRACWARANQRRCRKGWP